MSELDRIKWEENTEMNVVRLQGHTHKHKETDTIARCDATAIMQEIAATLDLDLHLTVELHT